MGRMKTHNALNQIGRILFAFVLLSATSLRAGQYFQDFSGVSVGATSFGDGSQLFATPAGVASVQDATYRELQLTASGTGNTRSALLLPDLDPGMPVYAFSAKWNTQIYRASTNDADGFSFNFGQLASLNLINASYFQEAGYPTGLCFSVQTYKDNNPGFYLRLNGNVIASLTNNPITQWGLTNNFRHFFEVDWHHTNGLTVRVDGQTIFSNVVMVGFSPMAGDRFVWAARTGGFTEQVRLDNIIVVTGGTLSQVPMTSPYYKSGENAGNNETADKAFDGQNTTKWLTFANAGFVGATASNSPAILVYALTSANDAPARDPKVWSVEGSNNNGTNWSVLGNGSGNFASRFETRGWLATNANSFNAFRLNVLVNNGGTEVQLAELRLYQFNAFGPQWTKTSAPDGYWNSIACSADGNNLVASFDDDPGYLWHSTDAGVSWGREDEWPSKHWTCLASSSSGAVLLAGTYHDHVFYSTNGGATWTDAGGFGLPEWTGAAVSADGKVFFLAGRSPNVSIISTNRGATWFAGPSVPWQKVAASTNGHALVGATDFGAYRSTDFGVTWTGVSLGGGFIGAACSADGTKFAISGSNYGVFISTNSGANWTPTSLANSSWQTLSASADFKTLIAGEEFSDPDTGSIMVSNDGGAHWSKANVPLADWVGSALSADGTILYAAGYAGIFKLFVPRQQQQPPSVVTGPATATTFFTTMLNGQASGNYLQTAAWFQWGTTTNYGNVTAAQNIGPSSVPTNFSSALGGLQPSATYHYRAVATNYLGTSYGSDATFTTPTPSRSWEKTGAPDGYWNSIACSADGNNLVGSFDDDPGYLWHSTDASVSWAAVPDSPRKYWTCLASSSSGAVLLAGTHHDNVFYSTNGGATWTDAGGFGLPEWTGAAVSGDGKVFFLAGRSPNVSIISTNAGATWFAGPSVPWQKVAASSNGHALVGATDLGAYRSTDFGVTWTGVSLGGGFIGAACSADGTKLAVSGTNYGVFISTNSGANWTPTSLANSSWQTLSASADFQTLIAAEKLPDPYTGSVMVSKDGGAHWSTETDLPLTDWFGSAMSADGTTLYAAGSAGIFKTSPPPTPQPPSVVTGPATAIALYTAMLNGQASGNYLQTAAWFQWGTTTNYGNVTAAQNIGLSSVPASFSSALGGLQPSATYHYRVVATNYLGTSYGSDATFTTYSTNVLSLTLPGDTIIASSANSPGGEGAGNVIDGSAATKYLNFDKMNTGFTVFPSITNRPLRALTIVSANAAPERNPASYKVEGSMDGANFTLVASNAVPVFPADFSIQSFSFANDTAFKAYRITFPTVANPATANSMQVAEVELLPYGEITSTIDAVTLSLPASATLAPGGGSTNSLLDHMLAYDTNKLVVLTDSGNVVMAVTPASGSSVVKGFELIGGSRMWTRYGRVPPSLTTMQPCSPLGCSVAAYTWPAGTRKPSVTILKWWINASIDSPMMWRMWSRELPLPVDCRWPAAPATRSSCPRPSPGPARAARGPARRCGRIGTSPRARTRKRA